MRLEAIAIRLEAIAIRLETIAIRLETIAIRLEAIAIRLEAIASRLEAIASIGVSDVVRFCSRLRIYPDPTAPGGGRLEPVAKRNKRQRCSA